MFHVLLGMEFREELHNLGSKEGLKDRKLSKASESFAWNITVLKVSTKLKLRTFFSRGGLFCFLSLFLTYFHLREKEYKYNGRNILMYNNLEDFITLQFTLHSNTITKDLRSQLY